MNRVFLVLLLMIMAPAAQPQDKVPAHPYVKFETTEGDIIVELDGQRAPITVTSFLAYVEGGYFDGTVFHRVIADFMIQGGGFTPGLDLKEPDKNIFNESGNGLRNDRGTIAMARGPDPHTASSQFYINVKNNNSLNSSRDGWGHAVFGFVIDGMDVVDAIASVRTGPQGRFSSDVPNVPVIIKKAYRFEFE